MKKLVKVFCTLILGLAMSAGLMAQTAAAPALGDGSEGNPYQIASLDNLYWLSAPDDVVPSPNQAARWVAHYIQTADIDASATSAWNSGDHDNDANTADEPMGFLPIGNGSTRFTGFYDGGAYSINNLFINRPTSGNVGLFWWIQNAKIQNIGLTNISITGKV
ncbi:MAG: hypothetical protein WCT23_09110 [Candidatus Neomarinimicrobiota bacterium]|jgi:hypothetical protein